ncbi:uncharacterized protein LOC129409841 [Boleophthalmus pectinirostris]|uniref:uncharacterized protein LOC129409841 n=1 Tax=Boleophthalmus pectinirostris TaxID=150288 RepID=UPI00242A7C0A|nr:uncharacterized protein LOC129409841 [Boleophthalmus pectinirostris]
MKAQLKRSSFTEKNRDHNKGSMFPAISNGPLSVKEDKKRVAETYANNKDKSLHLPVIRDRHRDKVKPLKTVGLEDLLNFERNNHEASTDSFINHVQVKGDNMDSETDGRCSSTLKNNEKKDGHKDFLETTLKRASDSLMQVKLGPSQDEKRFTVYICGGYKDSVVERGALMDIVYPRLYLYCKQRGYDFRMIDLRCGVGNPISEHHDTARLHLDTLKKCQETQCSGFFLFVGQKYEVRSLPATIQKEEFEAIMQLP